MRRHPRATVDNDGSFTREHLRRQRRRAGRRIRLTVQWYKPVKQGNDLVGGPNVLPVKYASPQTSDVRITVAAGENRLKPIQLR